ncbi:hypothetical protein PR048_012259 [Dryococelus australis]|uniref:Uncharacterized protein n=1 Tax=Dryococelus australis TaxID=614101 RepID=A0ABQ9HNW9_9NEOP|nr:hypothetical protein PR048_012259 [Dryococelus australis]
MEEDISSQTADTSARKSRCGVLFVTRALKATIAEPVRATRDRNTLAVKANGYACWRNYQSKLSALRYDWPFSDHGASLCSGYTTRLPPSRTVFVSQRGRSRIFECGYRTRRCRWSAGFSRALPFPSPLHSSTAPFSPHFTLVSSQDLVAKSRPNLFTRLTQLQDEEYLFPLQKVYKHLEELTYRTKVLQQKPDVAGASPERVQ